MAEKKRTESKSKYGALIQKAREPEDQPAIEPKDQLAEEPENQITIKEENQVTRQPDAEAVKEREVNLCVKVPESLRRHWAAESKRQGITMTEVIVQALSDRFGTPDSRG